MVMSANTPYSNPQGYATRSCCCFISNAVVKSLLLESVHQATAMPVNMFPNTPYRHSGEGHQVQEAVHGEAPHQPNPVDVVEVKLPREHDERPKSHCEDYGACKVAISSYGSIC